MQATPHNRTIESRDAARFVVNTLRLGVAQQTHQLFGYCNGTVNCTGWGIAVMTAATARATSLMRAPARSSSLQRVTRLQPDEILHLPMGAADLLRLFAVHFSPLQLHPLLVTGAPQSSTCQPCTEHATSRARPRALPAYCTLNACRLGSLMTERGSNIELRLGMPGTDVHALAALRFFECFIYVTSCERHDKSMLSGLLSRAHPSQRHQLVSDRGLLAASNFCEIHDSSGAQTSILLSLDFTCSLGSLTRLCRILTRAHSEF